MGRLAITHETRYEYDHEVGFGEWRLMLRPTDSHALRVVSAKLEFSPSGKARWAFDAWGNSICYLTFAAPARVLSITSRVVVDRYPAPLDCSPDDPEAALPALYDHVDLCALAPLMLPATDDPDGRVRRWIREQARAAHGPALQLLRALNQRIHDEFSYNERHEEGVQAPAQTLALKSGSCRDFAWLMIEAARRLGFASRFASGYVAPGKGANRGGAGATHAWCEVFLPSLGWVGFDPTNARAESADLIRVASTRLPEEASPVRGTISEPARSSLYVSVDVEPVPAEPTVG